VNKKTSDNIKMEHGAHVR